ncbi:MAG: DUF1223 domain-containing protein [Gammaproteobacteria bacterium]|nr:MAG: DUF1223 domain-containing protein [Gammaproteobacteria bacterium]
MKKLILLVLFFLSVNIQAKDVDAVAAVNDVKTVTSPDNRVVLLELYTSEGCSSCPPADRFLSDLKAAGISDQQLIPLAFHVTYWDYIGWKDQFAKKQYDERQRELAHKKKKSTVYTPQFVLSGDGYRSYATFSEDVNRLAAQKTTVDLVLTARVSSDLENTGKQRADKLHLNLKTDISASEIKDVGFYLVVIENNLASGVSNGENEGMQLHHDYVVRQLTGPYFQSKPENQQSRELTIILQPEWKRQDLSIVAFAENPHTGEVLQAVRLGY